jgi:DNA-binding SARP family transcriptional activator
MSSPEICVNVVAGSVTVDGTAQSLTRLERRLVFALAVLGRWVEPRTLRTLIWPNGSEEAHGSVWTAVHRTRRRLRAQAIVSGPRGYTLSEGVRVDIWEARTILSRRREGHALTDERLVWALRFFRSCEPGRWGAGATLDLPEEAERRVRSLFLELGDVVAEALLLRGDPTAALDVCDALLAFDDCDERAWGHVIKAHVAADNHAAAVRAFSACRRTLLHTLELEPSPALRALVAL